MPPILLLCAGLALAFGFVMGLLMAAFTERERAHETPIGSILMGIVVGFSTSNDFIPVLLGGFCGWVGWLIYRRVFPLKK